MKRLLGLLLSLGLAMGAALADGYPGKPVSLIVPLPAGGPTDAAARIIAEALARALGQPFVVINRPGAEGAIGARAAATAAADGYTLLFGVASLVALPLLQEPPPLDVARDLSPVATIGRFPFVLSVHPAVPATDVAAFVAFARSREEPLMYAASTAGEELAAAEFRRATGVRLTRVPYKGSAQAIPDLLAGRVQVMFGPVASVLPHARDGRLRLLAALTPARIPALPELPTLAEAGIADVTVPSWQAVFAPAGTPQPIVARLAAAIDTALSSAEVRAQLDRLMLQPETSSPQALARRIDEDGRIWQRFARDDMRAAP
ncbi:tripartite-type tricarboxylate transporter receptor subunit TctC [Plasticicumulans lactativorans]|uniref:Tripartite-type tricarboxylate transporter receptor subunit TctC n=1 Tax=Plasticicumulans lactativorans TaxID=1133106 RepID=A0A4R2L9X6_9GAMM|nr:tripartite tricarboxylate transporter substrate binding protein [Plasticicumulans lactativorans]TCO79578.1 tripartite-type tricarboxylate transporter receptor subunit TctC [Plasticicumulans lactativorans]